MISNIPCLNCFKQCMQKFYCVEDKGPVVETAPLPKSSFLDRIKSSMPTPADPKKPKVVKASPTLNAVALEVTKRRCVEHACGLVPSKSQAWRNEETDLLSLSGIDVNPYTNASAFSGTFSGFAYALGIRSEQNTSTIQLNEIRRVYLSKSAGEKSRYLMKLYILLAPITCPNCSVEYIPFRTYQRQREIHGARCETCDCPFCGHFLTDWGEVFKMKDWSYMDMNPNEFGRILKWSLIQ